MKRINIITLASAISIWGISSASCLAQPASLVKDALSFLEAGDLEKAESSLQKARFEEPDSFEINYNLGIVSYRKRDYEKSVRFFARASELVRNPDERFNTFYNMGNAAFKGYDYQLAITAYKNALAVKTDYQADYNLKIAEKKLQEQIEKMKKEQEEQQKQQENQQNNQQQEQNKDNKNSDKKDQQGNQQNKNQDNQNNKQEQQENQNQQGKQNQQGNQNQQDNQSQSNNDQNNGENQQNNQKQSESNNDKQQNQGEQQNESEQQNSENQGEKQENSDSDMNKENSESENASDSANLNDSDRKDSDKKDSSSSEQQNQGNEEKQNDETLASATAPINEVDAHPEEDRRDVKMQQDKDKGKVKRSEASQKARAIKNIRLSNDDIEAYLKQMEQRESEYQKHYRINNIEEKDPAYMNPEELREWMKVRNKKREKMNKNQQDW